VTLLGRDEALEALAAREAAGTRTRLVGAPGIGRRALREALGLDEDPEGVPFVVGPLELEASVALLRRALRSLAPERDESEDLLAELALRVDGIPALLELAARHAATRGADATLRALQAAPVAALVPEDPRSRAWSEEVARLAHGALPALAIFGGVFDEAAAREVVPESAEELATLVESGLVLAVPAGLRLLGPIRRQLRALVPPDDEVRRRHTRWTLSCARAEPADLRRVFEEEEPEEARRAGARLAPVVADRGAVDAHLARLSALHARIGDGDAEVERAIALLHLVLGEPEIAWRRLEAADDGSGAHRHLAANVLRRLGRRGEAEQRYREAVAALELEDDRRELGLALSNFGGLMVERGDNGEARALWGRALRCFALAKDARAEAVTLGDLGLLDHEAGALDEAERRYRRALAIHEGLRNLRFVGIVSQDLGELLSLRGSPLEARRHLERAVVLQRRVGDARQLMLAEASLAFAELVAGDEEAARARLDAVRDRAPEDLHSVMALHAAGLRLGALREANAEGDLSAQKQIVAEVESAVSALGEAPDEARRAAQMILAELGRLRRARGWTIAEDARFFVTPDDARVELARKKVWRRLLVALLERRLEAPGEALSMETLVRRGWPDQRVLQSAARNRLHVALSGLRKAGLDPLIQKCGDGYLLDPEVEVAVQRSG